MVDIHEMTATREINRGLALRALELVGEKYCNPTSQNHKPWITTRFFGEDSIALTSGQIQGLEFLCSTTCKERSPKCSSCSLLSFCSNPPRPQEPVAAIGFIDLFCGAGGLSLGIEAEGFTPSLAIDNDAAALKTYLANRPQLPPNVAIEMDLTSIPHFRAPRVPLVVGGPPCQGFSNANKQRLTDDPRNQLYKSFLDIVARSGANVLLMENVAGMAKYESAILRDLESIGFSATNRIIDTADLFYPQRRKRLFWLGIRNESVVNPADVFEVFWATATQPVSLQKFVLEDAISDLPPLSAKTQRNATSVENDHWGYTIASPPSQQTPYSSLLNGGMELGPLLNHRTKYNNPRDIEIYGRLSPGETSAAASIRDLMPYKSREHIFKDKFYKLRMDRPCKTLTAHMYYDCHMYIHPSQARGLTPREAARIQGFPDNYRFVGLPNQWYRQIGNAVSPLISRHIGRGLKAVFAEYPLLLKVM